MLRVAGAIDGRLSGPTSGSASRLPIGGEMEEGDDVEMKDAPARAEESGRNGRLNLSSGPDRGDMDLQGTKKSSYNPHVQMLKPKNSTADQDAGDTSFGAVSSVSETEPSTPQSAPYSLANGMPSYSTGPAARMDSFQPNSQGESSVFGSFRSSIPQEVFEKIKERITASREREKQSVAKQILRKEEEKRKLAREQDVEDLEATIRTLRENIRSEKSKRQLIFAQLKQKVGTEEGLKKQITLRDRGREMSNHVIHHSYPNATMLISQTNPSMRPRLMQNYQPINLPMNAMLHQNNSHMDSHTPNLQKRQRSVSPGQIPGPSSNSSTSRLVDSGMGPARTHLQPPPHKMSRPGAQTTPDTHGGSSQSSRPPINKSPSKSQTSTPVHHSSQNSSSSQQQQQPVTMAGPFAVASPYGGALGNQVLCLVNPNMVGSLGTAPNGQPQFLNPTFLQKPEHFAALTPQQQQALMAQQLHVMGQMTPEYFHRALQHLSDTQQRSASSEANAALYRQYQAMQQSGGGLGPQPVLLRPGLSMAPDSGSASGGGGQSRSAHSSSNAPSSSDRHSSGGGGGPGQNSDMGSQRVGGITSGQPVFGHAMAHPYGMTGGGGSSASSNSHAASLYPRTGASS